MARTGKNGGVILTKEELSQLTQGINVTTSQALSKLGISLDTHLDLLVDRFESVHGMRYYGPDRPFKQSANSSYFHTNEDGRSKEKDRYGVSFHPNLDTPENRQDPKKAGRSKIVCLKHGSMDQDRITICDINPGNLNEKELNNILRHSLFKVKEQGQSRDLTIRDLGVYHDKQGRYTSYFLRSDIEYDKQSIEKIQKEYGLDSRQQRIDGYQKRFINMLPESKANKKEFQKQLSVDMNKALENLSLYEQYRQDHEPKRFNVRNSNYINKATEDTLKYGIGNLQNIWHGLYNNRSVFMATDIDPNGPFGKFFVEKIAEGIASNQNPNTPQDNANPQQTAQNYFANLQKNAATFVVYNKYDENGKEQRLIQRIGSVRSPQHNDQNKEEKRLLAGGGGFDGHYLEVLGQANPNADVKPPKNIFILEGVKTAVDFAGALDIQNSTQQFNETVVLATGSADNMPKVAKQMAKQYEDAMIAIVADNDAKPKVEQNNSLTNQMLDNTGVIAALEAKNSVINVRKQQGVHPNVVVVVPPFISDTNGVPQKTDVADLREYYMSQANNEVFNHLKQENSKVGGVGIKTDVVHNEQAKQYVGRVYTQAFATTISNCVNKAIQDAFTKSEVTHQQQFNPALVETSRNYQHITPLPKTFGKKRKAVDIDSNLAYKAEISHHEQTLLKQTPQHLKEINPHMWSHRGFNQSFDNQGNVVGLKQTTDIQKIVGIANLLNDTLDKNNPLHSTVNTIGINAYKQIGERFALDTKQTAYGTLFHAHKAISGALSNNNSSEQLKNQYRMGFIHLALATLSPNQQASQEALGYFINNKKQPDKHPLPNPSTTVLGLVQMTSNDLANHAKTPNEKQSTKLQLEKSIYNAALNGVLDCIKDTPAGFINKEPKEHFQKSLEFSKEYMNIINLNKINSLSYQEYKRLPENEIDSSKEEELKTKRDAYKQYTHRIQNGLFGVASNKEDALENADDKDNKNFYDKLQQQFPNAKQSIENLKDYDLDELNFHKATIYPPKNSHVLFMPNGLEHEGSKLAATIAEQVQNKMDKENENKSVDNKLNQPPPQNTVQHSQEVQHCSPEM